MVEDLIIETIDSSNDLNPLLTFNEFVDFDKEIALMVIDRAKLQINEIIEGKFVVIKYKNNYTWLTKKQYNGYNSIKHIS